MTTSDPTPVVLACLSLGSNIGEREQTLARALDEIAAILEVRLVRVSSLYATDPVGYLDQPEFVNCAAIVETSLGPEDLLERLRTVELKLGRLERTKWREREIDIDVVLYGELVLANDRIVVPHREMHARRFVLEPLAEIAPEAIHPLLGLTVRELLERTSDKAGVRRVRTGDPRLDTFFPS